MPFKTLRLICTLLFVTTCSACVGQQTWLLQTGNGGWKKFNNESDWQKAAEESQPLETAVVNRMPTGTSIVYDVQGESGDWRNVDRYLFARNGRLIRLRRTFASESQDIKVTQIFKPDASGAVKETQESEISLSSGKPKHGVSEGPQIPVASDLQELEFMKTLK